MQHINILNTLILSIFFVGYLAIIFEYYIKVNKTASAILMAVISWTILFVNVGKIDQFNISMLDVHIGNVSQLIFFLIGVMTIVELIDSHQGFKIITDIIVTRSPKKIVWFVGILSFFLSAVLDNLTTTILMVSLLRKLVKTPKERMFLGAIVVVAANAGGAWTPIGDVTTTMLWIKGHVTTLAVMRALFLPSICSLIISLTLFSFFFKRNYSVTLIPQSAAHLEPGAKIVLFAGISALLFIPIFRAITGLPPFMGVFVGLGILWLITDIKHHGYESRYHLKVPYVLTKIDVSGVLFFLGILLCINALEIIGVLKDLAILLDRYIGNLVVIATSLGLISAVVDNVPIVAATTAMYDLQLYPPNSPIWQMIAYAAGTGGSILVIGSAAGVALMGLEKVDFIWYLKRISLISLIGYLAGMGLYLVMHFL